jgi:plastocyanin
MTRSCIFALILGLSTFLNAQDATVKGVVNVVHHSKNRSGSADVVVWLTNTKTKEPVTAGPIARLLQKDKQFSPHMVTVTAGTTIEFPNRDPFFHDVFSIYHGKPFDLGLYESGTIRKVRFSETGVSYIFCNIHPEMSAVVVALSTPHFAVSTKDGGFQISHVPPGRYKLELWYELASDSEMASLSREFEITTGSNVLSPMILHSTDAPHDHVNKYGETYPRDKPSKY